MAGIDGISQASGLLEDALLELRLLLEMCDSLAGDREDLPPWIYLVGNRFREVNTAAYAYMNEVHVHALPHLRDLANAAKQVSGGMGAMAPMVTKVTAGQSSPSRA